MSVENTKTNVTAQDNSELSKVLNELGVDTRNNLFFQMIIRSLGALNNGDIFRELFVDAANGTDGRWPLEYSYNDALTGAEDKFKKVITDKLDFYTFKALITNGPVECTITFKFNDASFVFKWAHDLKHLVGVQDGDVNNEHVYNEINKEFVLKNEYLKSLNTDSVEENEGECQDSPEITNDEEKVEEIHEESCTPVNDVPCLEKCDTSFADQLYEKLNGKLRDDNFNKYKGDLIIAFHRIFDYEMYEQWFNDNRSEIVKIKFTLEDALKVCPSTKVGKFWDKISSQKIVGLIADEFKFKSVMTYLDQDGTHCVVCRLK